MITDQTHISPSKPIHKCFCLCTCCMQLKYSLFCYYYYYVSSVFGRFFFRSVLCARSVSVDKRETSKLHVVSPWQSIMFETPVGKKTLSKHIDQTNPLRTFCFMFRFAVGKMCWQFIDLGKVNRPQNNVLRSEVCLITQDVWKFLGT